MATALPAKRDTVIEAMSAGCLLVTMMGAVRIHPLYMALHPVETGQRTINTVKAISHPVDTSKAIVGGIAADWNSGMRGQGRMVGTGLAIVASVAAPQAEAGILGNLMKVDQTTTVEQAYSNFTRSTMV